MFDVTDFIGEEFIGGKTFVTVKIEDETDDIAYKTIAFSKPPFIPPVTLSEENDEQIFSFDVTAERFLKVEMLPNTMSPNEFLIFMKNLTEAIVRCDDYFMNPLNLLILEKYIYVNPGNYDVRLIYAPFCDPIFSEANINSNIFKISRRFAKTTGGGWQDIITRLWNMSESTSVYEANELFNALYDENRASRAVDEKPPENKGGTKWWGKSNDTPKEPERVQSNRQTFTDNHDANNHASSNRFSDTPTVFEPETEKKKRKLFSLGEKNSKNKKDIKAEQAKKQPKKQGKTGLFSNQLNANKSANIFVNERPEQQFIPTPDDDDVTQPLQPFYEQYDNGAQDYGQFDDGATQPPPGAYGQHGDDTTQPPPGYQIASSARFDFCGSKNDQHLPEMIRVEFRDNVFMIGRVKNGKNTCDFAFPEATRGVSNLHARITEKDGRYFITDMNTRYGTYVGFHKIAPMKEVELNDGEKVSFSMGIDYEFRIETGR